MIVGVGIDVVDVGRMRRLLERHPRRAADRLFTPDERAVCARRPVGAEACFAARFAAKEAFLKALGTGLSGGISWQDLSVTPTTGSGRPTIAASGAARARLDALGVDRVHVSLSHDAGVAAAVVVLETDTGAPR